MNLLRYRDTRSEQSILADLILFGDEIDVSASILTPDDFYSTSHQLIFSAIQQLFFTGRPVTIVSVWEAIGKDLNRYGGAYYLAKLTDEPVPRCLKNYCLKIRTLARKRRAVMALAKKYFELTGEDISTAVPKNGDPTRWTQTLRMNRK